MKTNLAFGALLGLVGGSLAALPACPGPSPASRPDVTFVPPTPYDAPIGDALTPCQLACSALERAGCVTFTDCPAVLSNIEKDRLERTPDGAALTCAAIATAARPQDLGLPCTP